MLLEPGDLPAKLTRGLPGAGRDGPPPFGGGKPFHDGSGLCSPGRWPHHARSYDGGFRREWLRKRTLEPILAKVGSLEQLGKEAFRMAAGGERGCSLASDQGLHEQLLHLWKDWLEAQDLEESGLLDVAPKQPLYLRLLRAMLEAAADPDRDFLRQADEGLPVGVLELLPRTPHVFEEQLKWPLENSPWEASLAWVPNYRLRKGQVRGGCSRGAHAWLRCPWESSWDAMGSTPL